MLGRLRRTTRLDVGLALTFVGLAFLVWALVAGVAREMLRQMIADTQGMQITMPAATRAVKLFFVDTGFVIDLVGLGLMVAGLVLVFFASRQRIGISWAWAVALLQGLTAALGGVLVVATIHQPYRNLFQPVEGSGTGPDPRVLEQISRLSLPVVIVVAVLVWVVFLVAMLVDRARLDRRGPTLTDGLRTNR